MKIKKEKFRDPEAILKAAKQYYNHGKYAEVYDCLIKTTPPKGDKKMYGKFYMLRALSQYQLFTTQAKPIKPKEMLDDFKIAKSAMPDNQGVRYYCTMVTGLVRFALNDKEGAIKWLSRARELDLKTNNMANCYLRVMELTSKSGFKELPYCRLAAIGIYNFRAGNLNEAAQAFEKADVIKPDDHITGFFEPYISKIRKVVPDKDKQHRRGEKTIIGKVSEASAQTTTQAISESEESEGVKVKTSADSEEVKELIEQGKKYLEKDRLSNAIYCFDQARRLNNESVEANYWQMLVTGMSQMKQGELSKASQSLQESLKWKVNDQLATSRLLLMLAILELIKDNINEAHTLLKRARGYSPNDPFIQSWQIIIECMEKIQEKDIAHANILVKRAEKLDPQNVLIRCFSCVISGMLGLKTIISEIKHKKHITKVSPKIIKSTLNSFKEASWLNSKVKKAAYLREVVSGLEQLRLKKKQEALLALYNAKRIDPANPLAWQLLAGIEKTPSPHEMDLVKTMQVNTMLETEIDHITKDIMKVLPTDAVDRIVKTDLATKAADVASTSEVAAEETEEEETPNIFLSVFTEIEDIDQDHEHLIKQINRLLNDIEAERKVDIIKGSFDFLRHAVQFHLDFESRLMEEHNYPEKDYKAHQEDHSRYMIKVEETGGEIDRYKLEGVSPGFDMLIVERIVDPFIKHIENYDVPLGEFLKSNSG